DAVALVLSEEGCQQLMNEAAAQQFVMDAFGHLKAIGASAAARPLLDKAREAAGKGLQKRALELADEAVAAAPDDLPPRIFRAGLHLQNARLPEAVVDLNRLIEIQPDRPDWWQTRGETRFRVGDPTGAVADFDEVIRLRPQSAPKHWQRGIALFYEGRYADGRDQFALHRQVNPDDVENATWHFLCAAKLDGFDKARAQLLPVGPDGRVPMKEVYALYAGKGSVVDIEAAVAAEPPGARRQSARFYADLYLALYEEAAGRRGASARYITAAAKDFAQHGYMGDVARIHALWLTDELAKAGGKKP
ncbi:MAG: tetratricopeptide repeat protein, partial [Limisphaerales bacterium]